MVTLAIHTSNVYLPCLVGRPACDQALTPPCNEYTAVKPSLRNWAAADVVERPVSQTRIMGVSFAQLLVCWLILAAGILRDCVICCVLKRSAGRISTRRAFCLLINCTAWLVSTVCPPRPRPNDGNNSIAPDRAATTSKIRLF